MARWEWKYSPDYDKIEKPTPIFDEYYDIKEVTAMKYMIRLTAFLLCATLLTGCAAAPAASSAQTIAEPVYPEMAPYPNEEEFVDPVTGEFDDEGFSEVYMAWWEDQQARADVIADSLEDYFRQSIPEFLSAEGNGVCSPLNIYMALSMLAEITDSDSRQEILNLLNADSMESLRSQAGDVWNAHYCDDGASACLLADSLWLDQALEFDQNTVSRLASDYYASVFQSDLGSEEANQLLRDWINKQTQGLLEEQAANLELDPQTVLALASTIYYRAKWSDEFRPENNTEDVFHSPYGDRTVTYMNRELSYGPYYWGDDFGAVFLRMEDGSKMWLFLPDEGLTPADVLTSGQALDLTLGGWRETEEQKSLRVNLRLPKFDVGSDFQLNEALKNLGITSVFAPQSADFSPILSSHEAWLDTVNHAARVKIDEEGVEAAAYTVMAVVGAGMPPAEEMDFILDRPFLFVITSQDNLPLFSGIVTEP